MSYLIFCSYEVGGWPFKMAEILNRHGVRTYYISVQKGISGHDSKEFHYGDKVEDWELSSGFKALSSPKEIRGYLREICVKYNITDCFATGWESYILKQAGINYTYWCFGTDLEQFYFYPIWDGNYSLWNKFKTSLTFLTSSPKSTRLKARMTIDNSDCLLIAPYQIRLYNKLSFRKKLAFLPNILTNTLKVTEHEDLLKRKEESRQLICDKIKTSQFLFSSMRHGWCNFQSGLPDNDNKGNDIILKSYKKYLEISKDVDSKLVFVEKGRDVAPSKYLAKELGIDHFVVWVKEMPREELKDYYSGASICFGQFGNPCLTYSVLEPLAFGTPCISYYQQNVIHTLDIPYYSKMPPIMDSKEPDKIAAFIHLLLSDKKRYDNLVYKSWLWAKESCSEEKFVESFIKLFEK